MNDYFSARIDMPPFRLFSVSHLAALILFAVVNIGLIIWFKKRKTARSVARFGGFLAAFLLLNEACSLLWCAFAGVFTWDYALPVQLCDAAVFLSAVMLIRGNRTAFELVYFWGLGGSLQALITPDLYYPFPHFIFFNFFFLHGAIVTAVFYMVAVRDYKPTLKSIGKTLVYTNLYAGVIAIVNWITGGNYLFLSHKPEGASIIDFLGPWPWYILSLEGVLLVVCLLLYSPFAVKRARAEHARRSREMALHR